MENGVARVLHEERTIWWTFIKNSKEKLIGVKKPFTLEMSREREEMLREYWVKISYISLQEKNVVCNSKNNYHMANSNQIKLKKQSYYLLFLSFMAERSPVVVKVDRAKPATTGKDVQNSNS